MKKRFTYLIAMLAVICVLGTGLLLTDAYATEETYSGTCGENLTWVLDANGVLTISGSGEMYGYDWDAPWYNKRENIISVVIEEGVTSIGSYAFSGCSSLTSIAIPASVTSIGYYAFYECNSLEEVHILDISAWVNISFDAYSNPLRYGARLYLDGELVSDLVIPDGVTSISDYAFYNCSSLSSVTIPEGVTGIGEYAFYGCSSLTSIEIPKSVTSVGENAFYYCWNLNEVYIADISAWMNIDFTYAPSRPLYYGADLYLNGELVSDLVIPEGVTSIGDLVFYGCSSLTSVTIPDGVTSIGYSAFSNCSSLTSITIPEGVTSIGSYAFSGCSSLSSITIPEGVTSISDGTFSGCSSLTSITIPGSVTSIEQEAFSLCSNLTSITIPDGVTSIEQKTFSGCSSLTSITIPASVTSVYYEAFFGCSSLEEVYISDVGAWVNIWFSDSYANPLCYGANLYLNSERVTDLVIPDGVTSIGNYAFVGCSSLTSVTIPDNVTSICYYAFGDCSSLESITIPSSVTSISGNAFVGCTSLGEVHISDVGAWLNIHFYYFGNPLWYGARLYLNGELVSNLVIPNDVTSIGEYAFWGCSSLTSVTILEGVTSIGNYAFSSCSSLTSITIPDSVTSIGSYAFSGCNNLWHVLYTGTPEAWKRISIDSYNENLKNAERHYNCTGDEITDVENKFCTICHGGNECIWDGGVVAKETTCLVPGQMLYTCTVCGNTRTEEIPATNHSGSEIRQFLTDIVIEDNVYNFIFAQYCRDCDEEVGRHTMQLYMMGDVDGNGKVDIMDANLICSYYNELIDSFPAAGNPNP